MKNKSKKISVIMPVRLERFKTSAKNLEKKFIRAVESVNSQTHSNIELIVVSHGCGNSRRMLIDFISGNKIKIDIKGYHIDYTGWCPSAARNAGLNKATGNIICYLDADDIFMNNHIDIIVNNMNGYDWIWFDENIKKSKKWVVNKNNINIFTKCGTANIAHRKMAVRWNEKAKYGYEDWFFIQDMKRISNKYKYIGAGGYVICHVPLHTGRGYDI